MDILGIFSRPVLNQYFKRTSFQLGFLLILLIKCYSILKKKSKRTIKQLQFDLENKFNIQSDQDIRKVFEAINKSK